MSIIVNLIIAAAVAFIARQLGASDLVTFLVFWSAHRFETLLSIQYQTGSLTKLLVGAKMTEHANQHAAREAAVARIARNN